MWSTLCWCGTTRVPHNPHFFNLHALLECYQPAQVLVMGLLKNALAQLEIRLQTLIEGSAARIFASDDLQHELAGRLIDAMQAGVKTQAGGARVAPNLYTLTVHPSQVDSLLRDSTLLEQMAQTLQDSAGETGMAFLSPPVLRVEENEEVPPRQFQVAAQISIENLAETSDMIVDAAPNAAKAPVNAFLIVNGVRIFPLTQSTINIGRRTDNHLIIDDKRISRVHAQLRAIKSRYVIFDLDSRGGTFVNDQRIHQSILYPGDVISLAGVPLVFGQEESRLGETQKLALE